MGVILNWIKFGISSGKNTNGFGSIMSKKSVTTYPAYGTVLSSACGSGNSMDMVDSSPTYDVLGYQWFGNFTLWNYVADGSGGATWQMTGNSAGSSPCYYPYGFVTSGYSNNPSLHWDYNGTEGDYVWGNVWDVYFSDGNGGTIHDFGTYEFNSNGYTIASGWAEGTVRYISVGSWAFWYNYGYQLNYGWDNVYGNWGCGDVPLYTSEFYDYADGVGGSYRYYTGNYNIPSNGTFLQQCNDYNYYANGVGSYYFEPVNAGGGCDPYGTQINSAQAGVEYFDVGCGNWTLSEYSYATYADGNCSTYTVIEGYSTLNGTLLGNCNGNNYYSNGAGSYYSEGDGSGGGGGGCDPYGNLVTSGSYSNTYFINPTLVPEIGTTSYDTVTDGNCGTTNINYSTTWYPYGTSVGTTYVFDPYMGNITLYWHSDGNGGVYATLN